MTDAELYLWLRECWAISDPACLMPPAAVQAVAFRWSAPTGPGRVFSVLAQTGTVDRDRLLFAIACALPETRSIDERRALQSLTAWAHEVLPNPSQV